MVDIMYQPTNFLGKTGIFADGQMLAYNETHSL